VAGCADGVAVSAQSMGGRDYDPTRTARSLLIGSISSIPSYNWWVSIRFVGCGSVLINFVV